MSTWRTISPVNAKTLLPLSAQSTESTDLLRIMVTSSPAFKPWNHSPPRTFTRHHLTSSSTKTVLTNIQHHPSIPSTTIRVHPLENINGENKQYLTSGHHALLHGIQSTIILYMPTNPHQHLMQHTNALLTHTLSLNLHWEPHHHHTGTCSQSNHKPHSDGSIRHTVSTNHLHIQSSRCLHCTSYTRALAQTTAHNSTAPPRYNTC